jgi:uncharacterized protein (TIGR03067 family)
MPAGPDAAFVIKGDRFTSTGMGATYRGKLILDPAGQPKTFDLKFTAGPEKGNTNRGIYKLDGDVWQICLDTRGLGRPREFSTAGAPGRALETLQRAAAQPVSPAFQSASPRAAAATAAAAGPPHSPSEVLPPASDSAHPAPELEGEWAMLSCVQNGNPLPPAYLKFGRRVARGNEITAMNRQVMMKVRFTVDPSANPHAIDDVIAAGPSAGQCQFGIYKLEDDTLTTSIAALGSPRPADFSSSRGDGRLITSWVRLKP